MSRRKFKFANYGIKDGLTRRLVLGVSADRSNRIWTSTETAGLNLLNPVDGKFTSPFHISGVNRIVLSMTSINGNIYPRFHVQDFIASIPTTTAIIRYSH